MPVARRARLSGFEARWVAEAIRLREEADGPLEDRDATRAARAAGGGLEPRILHRAQNLAEREGVVAAVASWRRRSRALLALAALGAFVAGFGAALAVLGDGSRAVNVVWALGALLGVPLSSLALWAAALALPRGQGGGERGGLLGRAWMWASARYARGAAVHVARALAGLLARGRLLAWRLGAVTHALWCAVLCGTLAGLVVALSARRYGFVWETTILPAEAFVRFVEAVGALPSQLGFAAPDAEAVRRSGALAAPPDEGLRRAWSSWLVGCVVIYGVLPRLALWALCSALWRVGRRRVRLDLVLPGYRLLAQRLAPDSERIGVIDDDPGALPVARAAAPHRVEGGRAIVVGLELRDAAVGPPALPRGVEHGGVLDSGSDRRRLLESLAHDPPARLLVACDAAQSPDRGSLETIAALSRHAGDCRVLLRVPADGVRDRGAHWHDGLAGIGLGRDRVFDRDGDALGWLAGAPTEDEDA